MARCDHTSPRTPTRTSALRPHLIFDRRDPRRTGALPASPCGAVRAAVGPAVRTPRRVRDFPGGKKAPVLDPRPDPYMARELSSGLLRRRAASFRAWRFILGRGAAAEQAAREARPSLRRSERAACGGSASSVGWGLASAGGPAPIQPYIRSALWPVHNPACAGREARDGPDQSLPRGFRLTPGPGAVTGPIPDEANGLRTAARFSVGSGALQDRPLGNEAGLEVAPQRNGQFARHGDDGDAPDAPLLVADAPAEPLGERAVGLVMQP